MNTTKIIRRIPSETFKNLIVKFDGKIYLSSHCFDHFSLAQRKLFTESELKHIVIKQNPEGIGLQRNGRYAVFYKRKEGYLRVICEVKRGKFEIITFLNTISIPNLSRIENEK